MIVTAHTGGTVIPKGWHILAKIHDTPTGLEHIIPSVYNPCTPSGLGRVASFGRLSDYETMRLFD
jgi:hypothetical protein